MQTKKNTKKSIRHIKPIYKIKNEYIKARILEPKIKPTKNNTRAFYTTVKMLVDNQGKIKLPKTENNFQDEFAKFFLDKMEKIHTQFDVSYIYEPLPRYCTLFKKFW